MKTPGKGNQLAEELQNAFPRHNGEELRYRFPHNKARALFIDDDLPKDDDNNAGKPENPVDRLKRTELPHLGRSNVPATYLDEIYDFVPFRVTAKDLGSQQTSRSDEGAAFSRSLRKLRSERHFCGGLSDIDIVLLDLCLGEKSGEDPMGYQLLPVLKKLLPLIPIVAFTKFRDMGHVRRAYHRGASWFLSKEEVAKLPAHHLALIQNRDWEREWKAVSAHLEWDFPVGFKLADYEKHLIWKSVEHDPGGRIYVCPLGGGIGGGKTLHCSREINGRYDRAAPVVIKIDDIFAMLLERERYQRFIQPYLSNLAGRIDVPLHAGGNNCGAIAYTYAGTSQGRRGGGREVLSLDSLLQRNLPARPRDIEPAAKYEELFDFLLSEVLGRIHSIDPRPEPSEADYPNEVFWEFPMVIDRQPSDEQPSGSPLHAYLLRMPAEYEIDLQHPLTSDAGSTSNAPRQLVYVYDIKRDRKSETGAYIQGLARLGDGLFHRVDIKGLLGSFYANHRYLRPMQPLCIEFEENPEESCMAANWQRLWEQEPEGDAKEAPLTLSAEGVEGYSPASFTFESAKFEPADLTVRNGGFAPSIVGLVKWLAEERGRPRKALEGGRIGLIHGDMNLGNVMVERERGSAPTAVNSMPWLIDFAWSRRDWIVLDYTQFELDLCLRLIRYEFFPSLLASLERRDAPLGDQDWTDVDEFFSYFLETPWKEPPVLKKDERLAFVYHLMRQVRDSADRAGVRDEEYLASRVWQGLISHRIRCGEWRKNKKTAADLQAQFRCIWSLKQAFMAAKLLGWADRDTGSTNSR